MKVALISGATAGIGEATAIELSKKNYHIIATGRRVDRLKKLQQQLGQDKVTIAQFDICKNEQVESFAKEHKKLLSKIDVLVNNAGLAAGIEKLQDANVSDWDTMIDTNVKGLLYLTRHILPFMLEKQAGHIVNLGSVAGRWTYQGGGVYCATKFAVRALSEGLRMDLFGTPIRVSNIEPGMVETEFSLVRLKDKKRAEAVYAGMKPLTAQDIAETISWIVDRPSHVNIQELVIFPTDQAGVGMINRKSK